MIFILNSHIAGHLFMTIQLFETKRHVFEYAKSIVIANVFTQNWATSAQMLLKQKNRLAECPQESGKVI